MDSGAFSEIRKHGEYRTEPSSYAALIVRWKSCGNLLAAVTQDYMCEPFILEKTGMTVQEHQEKTVARYDELLRCDTGVYIMPVLQGYECKDYIRHLQMYGSRLARGAWVGVGSICKRNGRPWEIEKILLAINNARPDLLLHGFGLKATALRSGIVDQLLYSADSMAWSLQERMIGKGNDWREAKKFGDRIRNRWIQRPLFLPTQQSGERPKGEA
jgi:hypothetical protein